ncbi:uncharacterized protein LOC129794624 [Lutzomyia longipalpis]|uniref:uncharacterized protein LOC129794624 n=1 Tax=Lutzomyia longipalpis TaxID=7200 RepID=UPI0024835558|nr:uncharacterized protein LOC129794624 [Lutzomyia longipalpis]
MAQPPRRKRMYECQIYGEPQALPQNVLPTIEQTMKYYKYVENEMNGWPLEKKDPSSKEISMKVATKVEELWNQLQIPIITTHSISRKILRHRQACNKVKKSLHSSLAAVEKRENLRVAGQKLFDIAQKDVDSGADDVADQILFLRDQREQRLRTIDSVAVDRLKAPKQPAPKRTTRKSKPLLRKRNSLVEHNLQPRKRLKRYKLEDRDPDDSAEHSEEGEEKENTRDVDWIPNSSLKSRNRIKKD